MPGHSETRDELLGAVLAGGASRRMGRDKALLELAGETLLERAVKSLRCIASLVVVCGPPRGVTRALGVTTLADLRPGCGPLGGLHSALHRAAGRPVLVLACDLPNVSADLLRWLVGEPDDFRHGRRRLSPWVRLPRDAHGPQPLCALYSGGCLPAVERALEAGRLSLLDLLEDLESEVLDLDRAAGWYRPAMLANVNRPEDLSVVDLPVRGGR